MCSLVRLQKKKSMVTVLAACTPLDGSNSTSLKLVDSCFDFQTGYAVIKRMLRLECDTIDVACVSTKPMGQSLSRWQVAGIDAEERLYPPAVEAVEPRVAVDRKAAEDDLAVRMRQGFAHAMAIFERLEHGGVPEVQKPKLKVKRVRVKKRAPKGPKKDDCEQGLVATFPCLCSSLTRFQITGRRAT